MDQETRRAKDRETRRTTSRETPRACDEAHASDAATRDAETHDAATRDAEARDAETHDAETHDADDDDTRRTRATRPHRHDAQRRVLSDLRELNQATAASLRDLACALVAEPLDHELLTVLAAAALAANGVAGRALEVGERETTRLRGALEAAVALARPSLPETRVALGGCPDVEVEGRESSLVGALLAVLLLARGAEHAEIRSFASHGHARVCIAWLGTRRESAPMEIGPIAEVVLGAGGTLAELDDGYEITLRLERRTRA